MAGRVAATDGQELATAASAALDEVTTAHFRALMRRFASMQGFDPKKFGGHSARIGGATGQFSESMILSAKGRWQSDIGKIYARTRRAHLAASELMHGEC